MNEYVYEKLQYNELKQIIEGYCVSSLGKKLVQKLTPSGNKKVVEKRLQETTEGRRLLDLSGNVPLQGIVRVEILLGKIEKDSILDGEEISQIGAFLRGCRKIKAYMKDKGLEAPLLQRYSEGLESFAFIEEEIERCIRNNRVCDEASKELKKVRKAIVITEGKIEERLDKFLKNSANKPYIQEFFITKRNGRLTVPIKAAYKNKVEGVVVEATEKTAFIELQSVSKSGAELQVLQAEEMMEEYKILSALTEEVYQQKESIRKNMEVIAQYDLIFAKAKYSKRIEGRRPQMNDYGWICIKGGRHPLLEGKVVPLDFEIGKNYRSLMITGPNAGGKTIVLKTIGLLTLMMQSGFHIPVQEGTNMSVFEKVFVDIGDNQSIENALSTFSSHVKNIAAIAAQTNKATLLLFDEIGSGTEPSEGAALAIAILENLYQKGAVTIATTHYNEIKDFSAKHPDFENAAMQFNKETLEPLYQLKIHEEGESNALWIAKKMGISKEILEKAKMYMSHKEYDLRLVAKNYVRREKEIEISHPQEVLERGDKVILLEYGEEGIIYQTKTDYQPLLVWYHNEAIEVEEKRVKLCIKAKELYPTGYDLDALFSSFKERKEARDIARGSKKALRRIAKERKKG